MLGVWLLSQVSVFKYALGKRNEDFLKVIYEFHNACKYHICLTAVLPVAFVTVTSLSFLELLKCICKEPTAAAGRPRGGESDLACQS